ncbi:hypothetical protein ECANGB1_1723 [Enterospora canceri]|uniref:Uncharacterized protein n=1 Tax=Enterospora canceri TaxID=1081671 RepID=A0A1Y1S5M8_9MICR|nr:hypothetical protein ECANGB1_1723 [Enterospora canceri]
MFSKQIYTLDFTLEETSKHSLGLGLNLEKEHACHDSARSHCLAPASTTEKTKPRQYTFEECYTAVTTQIERHLGKLSAAKVADMTEILCTLHANLRNMTPVQQKSHMKVVLEAYNSLIVFYKKTIEQIEQHQPNKPVDKSIDKDKSNKHNNDNSWCSDNCYQHRAGIRQIHSGRADLFGAMSRNLTTYCRKYALLRERL